VAARERGDEGLAAYRFNVVLQGANETAFLDV
jgi:hypothetical protein